MQAAIAAVHDDAARVEDTDWEQILTFYGLLERMSGNPMVALNYEMAGDVDAAVAHYRAAARRTTSIPEQNYLTTQAARLRPQTDASPTL